MCAVPPLSDKMQNTLHTHEMMLLYVFMNIPIEGFMNTEQIGRFFGCVAILLFLILVVLERGECTDH